MGSWLRSCCTYSKPLSDKLADMLRIMVHVEDQSINFTDDIIYMLQAAMASNVKSETDRPAAQNMMLATTYFTV